MELLWPVPVRASMPPPLARYPLADVLLQPLLDFRRLEAGRAGAAQVSHLAIHADDAQPIGPGGVRLVDLVVRLIDQRRDRQLEGSHALLRAVVALLGRVRLAQLVQHFLAVL